MSIHKNFYKNNKDYTDYLSKIDISLYDKYVDYLKPESAKDKVLDVGCGTGSSLLQLKKKGYKNLYGIDVSLSSIKYANKKGLLKCTLYDGSKIPFKSNLFEKVGCFTVLEHVDNPEEIINEIIRVTKKGGKIIIASPNFLRCIGLKAEHPRVKGMKNSIKNLSSLSKKYITSRINPQNMKFDHMEPVSRKTTHIADFDAITVTNPLDVKFILRNAGVNIIYQSGLVTYHNIDWINKISTIPVLREGYGGFFIIGEKI